MQAIVTNYKTLQLTMEQSSHGSDDCSRHASGVLALMDTYFGLKLSILIFSMTLQSINTPANDGFFAVEVCIKALQRIRTDELFLKFFEMVRNEAADKCDPPVLPRKRQIPRRIDDGACFSYY